jgi:hypothetical protein
MPPADNVRLPDEYTAQEIEAMVHARMAESGEDRETALRQVRRRIQVQRPYVPLIRLPQPAKFPIRAVALQLVAVRGQVTDPLGSAVLIAPRLALTARHNLDEYSKDFDGRPLQDGVPLGFNIHAFQVFDDGQIHWDVVNTMNAIFADLTLLSLAPLRDEPRSEMRFVTPMDLVPPKLDDQVLVLGYHSGTAEMPDEKTLHLHSKAEMPHGPVREVFMEGRGGQLVHPCFHVACLLEGGMSGCPAFNTSGRLCGVAYAGAKASEGSEETAYFSLLWPAMGLSLGWEYAGWPPGTPLLDLARAGVIEARGNEHVALEPVGTRPVRWSGPLP